MRSVLHALIWDHFRYAGWLQLLMLSVGMLPLAIYAMILSVATSTVAKGDPVMFLLEVSMLPFVIFVLILSVAASHGNAAQLYTKPISNLSIAAWRNISGTVLLAIQVALIVEVYNWSFDVGWPLAGAILFSIAAWYAAQPFFCLAGKSISGALVTMIPIGLMMLWLFTRYKPIGGTPRDWIEITPLEVLQLLAVIAIFAWLSVPCTALARRGDRLPTPAWISDWFLALFNWPIAGKGRTQPFRSAQWAMFWYEWRWKGWILTACMLLLLAVMVPVEMLRELSLQNFYNAVSGAYAGTLVPAMAMAVLNGFQLESMDISTAIGKSTRLSDIDELRSFQAIRPVTDAELGRSNLWVCLASVSLMTGLWLLLVCPVLIVAASRGQLDQLFARQPFWMIPMFSLFLWTTTSNLTALASTGRTKFLGGAVIGLALAFVAVLSCLEWIDNQALTNRVLSSLLLLVTIALIAFAVWAFTRCLQLGFVTPAELGIAVGVSLLMLIIGLVSVPKLYLNTASGIACVSVLSVLPWATTPLATRWNRHR